MQLSRRNFLRAAVLAPMVAAAGPLLGGAGSRQYVRLVAASFDAHRMQICYTINMVVRNPRTMRVLHGITD